MLYLQGRTNAITIILTKNRRGRRVRAREENDGKSKAKAGVLCILALIMASGRSPGYPADSRSSKRQTKSKAKQNNSGSLLSLQKEIRPY